MWPLVSGQLRIWRCDVVDIGGYQGLSYAILLEALIELKSRRNFNEVEQYLDGFNETLWGEVLPVPRAFIHRTKLLVQSKRIKTMDDLKTALWELMLVSIIKHNNTTPSEIARNLSVAPSSVCHSLKKLQRRGVLRKCGSRNSKYRVSSEWKKYFGMSGQSIKI